MKNFNTEEHLEEEFESQALLRCDLQNFFELWIPLPLYLETISTFTPLIRHIYSVPLQLLLSSLKSSSKNLIRVRSKKIGHDFPACGSNAAENSQMVWHTACK